MILGINFVYLWALSSFLYIGVHTLEDNFVMELGPPGPSIIYKNWIGLNKVYTPRFNDWPNVSDPEYQKWMPSLK